MSSTPTREVISVSLQADIANIRKVLEQEMPEAGKKGAAQLLKEVAANYKAMEKAHKESAKAIEKESKRANEAQILASQQAAAAAERAAKSTGRSWNEIAKSMQSNQMISDMEQLGAMFIMVGGGVSKVAMTFTSLVRPVAMLGTLLGPAAPLAAGLAAIPLALFGIPAAANKAGAALLEMSRDAVKLQDDIRGMVPRQITDELRDLETQIKALDDQAKIHTATLTVGLQPATEAYMHIVAGLRKEIDDALPSARSWLETINDTPVETAIRGAAAVMTLGISEYVASLQRQGEAELERQRNLLANYLPTEHKLAKSTDDTAKTVNKLTREYEKADRAARKVYEAERKLGDLINESASDLSVGPMAKIQDDYNKRLDAIEEIGASEESTALAVEAAHDRMERDIRSGIETRLKVWQAATKEMVADAASFERDVSRIVSRMEVETQDFVQQLKQSALDSFMALGDSASQVMDLVIQLNNNAIAAAEERVARERELAQAAFDDYLTRQKASIRLQMEAGVITKKEAKAAVDAARIVSLEKEAALERIGKKEEEQAIKAFRANQNLQIAQAAIESFRAGISLIPAFAFLGPGAGIAAAATAAAAFGTALAAIQGQSPPEFPMGRVPSRTPDHRLVGVRDDEGITTPRGTAALGGAEAIRRANEGRGVSPSVINLSLDGRVIASVTAPKGDALLRPAPGPWLGRRPLYGR